MTLRRALRHHEGTETSEDKEFCIGWCLNLELLFRSSADRSSLGPINQPNCAAASLGVSGALFNVSDDSPGFDELKSDEKVDLASLLGCGCFSSGKNPLSLITSELKPTTSGWRCICCVSF
ncbi:hypothetical protein BMR11_14790 [Methylococcaceae bacterium CS5]|nr:hypothetical protein BMR11_14790 [Methylococcaceae bacterium CS5]